MEAQVKQMNMHYFKDSSCHFGELLCSPLAQMKHPLTKYWYTNIESVQISRCSCNFKGALLKPEAYWITELETLTPLGMKEDLDLRVFLQIVL